MVMSCAYFWYFPYYAPEIAAVGTDFSYEYEVVFSRDFYS